MGCGRSPKEGGLSGPQAGWGAPAPGDPCPLRAASLRSPVLPAGPLAQAQLFWRQPATAACTSTPRSPAGTLPGELPVTHQPLPWHGAGVSWGELLGPAGGAALPQSSGAPRLRTRRQWRGGMGLGEQSQGPGLAGLKQRDVAQRQLTEISGSRER